MNAVRSHAIAFLVCFFFSVTFVPSNFAQKPLYYKRAKSGLNENKPAAAYEKNKVDGMTAEDKKFVSRIIRAGRAGSWKKVELVLSDYAGSAAPVFSAGMTVALRLNECQAGVLLFERMLNSRIALRAADFTVAIRLNAKLGRHETVQQLWGQAQDLGFVDEFIFGAMIAAAADEGNATSAYNLLNSMRLHTLSPQIVQFRSAITACKNSNPPNAEMSLLLLEQLRQEDLQPDIITMTGIVGAHVQAPLSALKALRALIDSAGNINYNEVFIEIYFYALGLRTPPGLKWKAVSEAEMFLSDKNEEVLAEAASVLQIACKQNVQLTKYASFVEKALRNMNFLC